MAKYQNTVQYSRAKRKAVVAALGGDEGQARKLIRLMRKHNLLVRNFISLERTAESSSSIALTATWSARRTSAPPNGYGNNGPQGPTLVPMPPAIAYRPALPPAIEFFTVPDTFVLSASRLGRPCLVGRGSFIAESHDEGIGSSLGLSLA